MQWLHLGRHTSNRSLVGDLQRPCDQRALHVPKPYSTSAQTSLLNGQELMPAISSCTPAIVERANYMLAAFANSVIAL